MKRKELKPVMDLTRLVRVKPAPNEHLVSCLESLLDYAKKGELIGLAYVCQWNGNLVSNGWQLSEMHARKLIGEIEFMERDILDSVD